MNAFPGETGGAATEAAEKPKLALEVTIESPSDCKRHVIVRISEADVRRSWNEVCDEMRPNAEVPGFRPGRAPRKLVESRFRKEIEGRVKGNLLLEAVTQAIEDANLAAIGEPDFDIDAVIVPSEGPLTFEFDVAVRPDFELPEWKGLKLKRFQQEITPDQIDRQVEALKKRFAHTEAVDRPVEPGDSITADVAVIVDGKTVAEFPEEVFPVVPTIVMNDATVEGFDELMKGAVKGDRRVTRVTIGENAEDESLAGKEVEVAFTVRDIEATILPTMDELLKKLGEAFENEEQVREQIEVELARQIAHHNQDATRKQITRELIKDARWDLPDELIERQTERELARRYYELKGRGLSDAFIQARLNRIRQDQRNAVATAMREHFILERLAEEYDIDAEEKDFDRQIAMIAAEQGISTRRARARLEKRGELDVIRNQIIEEKVIDMIRDEAEFEDVPLEDHDDESEAGVPLALGGKEKAAIPEAKHPDEPQDFKAPKDRN